jgi:serine/threonine protein kinase/tetratricopeptide (TPR) repeat protein
MDRWERISALFDQVRDIPPNECETFLRRECPDDPDLIREVLSLLEHRSDEFLENPDHLADRPDPPAAEIPSTIGPYKILSELGSGGMGVVYLAEQQRPVERKVALKVIQQGMLTKQVMARFDTERQALALMSHPNIARVYDAGTTDSGNPYFVMEYVEGVPITEHCDQHRLGSRERLELFADVCDGLQHAHQKGIIHRDIKAPNLLVTTEDDRAVAKIIDFGISKAVDRRLTEVTAHTELGQVVGTPEYMSPEQAELTGQDIDTRTDIYSLGVLLYVLLVGELPFDSAKLRGASFDELRRMIREDDPPRPSTRFTSLGDRRTAVSLERKADPGSFVRELRGDLDWIVMKALDKDRTRRYATAAEFAADVRRYLNDEPVIARPPGAGYQMAKFVRRHRVGVSAAGLVLVLLILGSVGTTVGMLRAKQAERTATEEAQTSDAVVSYLFDIFENADPEATSLREVTAEEILEAGKTRIEQLADRPLAQARLATEIGRIYRAKGEWNEARLLLERALDIKRETPGVENIDLLRSINQVANLEMEKQNFEKAAPFYEEALTLAQVTLEPESEDLATILRNLGECLRRVKDGDLERSRAYLEQSLAIREAIESPKIAQSVAGLAGVLVKLEDYDGAIPLYERSLEERIKVYPKGHPRIGIGHQFLAETLDKAGKLDEAREHYDRALEIFEARFQPEHNNIRNAVFGIAGLLAANQNFAGAEPLYQRALDIDEANYGTSHRYLTPTLSEYALCLRDLGRLEEAIELEARVEEIQAKRRPAN